ncbi:MAG: archaemetzincin family Zn-dependent metalloprotease [Candidatus Marinimicrobia bacterium]|nr:archaemetzincin family Zn-dependent metalloprotease [Candidatus Neomarinimicrobiota bacterium]
MNEITLLTLSEFELSLIDFLSENIENELEIKIIREKNFIHIADYYNIERRQYNADKILKFVYDSQNIFQNTKVIALLDIDLYIPILTYIFGQAYLNGNAGIASSYRLKHERYGMKKNEKQFRHRFLKEILHELGHTYGLKHCLNTNCVMRSSTYVEDIDQKKSSFCKQCKLKIKTS